MPKKILVSDTNIWIDLDRGGLLEAVFSLPHEFVTTDFVWDELHQPSGQSLEGLGLAVESMSAEDIQSLSQLTRDLHNSSLADVSCFHLAQSREWTLLTNDGAVRKAGRKERLDVRGVLWLLDELYLQQVVSGPRLIDALGAMIRANARLPEAECERLKEAWRNRP